MSALKLIIEDGSCVENANSYSTVEDARAYWKNRFGGEAWDLSVEGKNHCDDDICKALVMAIDYLRCLDFPADICSDSCVPTPVQCDCRGKDPIVLLKEAQIIIADAILRGWRSFSGSMRVDPLVSSISCPDEGSVTYAAPIPLSMANGLGVTDSLSPVTRVKSILRPILINKKKGFRVLS